jgi:hypothetical protein
MMLDGSGARLAGNAAGQAWTAGVTEMVARLGTVGRVAILRDGPWGPHEVPTCLSANVGSSGTCAFLATVTPEESLLAKAEATVAQRSDGVVVSLQPAGLVCPEDVCRAVAPDGTVVFRDRHHMTATYSRSLASPFGDLVAATLPT